MKGGDLVGLKQAILELEDGLVVVDLLVVGGRGRRERGG